MTFLVLTTCIDIGLSLFGYWSRILFVLAWALIATLMMPIMYRQRCRASQAVAVVTRLIAAHSGTILLYVFFVALALASVQLWDAWSPARRVASSPIPYVGTVILLPLFVSLVVFSLLFLRQFGPDYDVWSGFLPPEILAGLMPPPSPSGTEAG